MVSLVVWGIVVGLIGSFLIVLCLNCICESSGEQDRFEYAVEYKPRSSKHPEQNDPNNSIDNNLQPQDVLQSSVPKRNGEIVDVEDSDEENVSYHEEDEVNQPTGTVLSELAISKHIAPNCYTDQDAIRKSEERDRYYSKTDTNHVFRATVNEFHVVTNSTGKKVSDFLLFIPETSSTKKTTVLGINKVNESMSILAMYKE